MKFSALTRIIFAISFLLVLAFVSLGLTKTSFAQSINPVSQPQQIQQAIDLNTNPDVPRNLHTFTQNVMIEVMSAMICQIAGVDVTDSSQNCLGVDPKTKKIGFVSGGGGLIGVLQNSIVTMYTPPLHTSDYLKYLSANFGLAKKSYAASNSNDLGYNSISPLSSVWVASRNVAYLFFVLIFLIIGIGIMLRVHIDPRTVMTIQNQIPKIIIAIVLVTFSFAIAGLLIDLMYVISYLLLNLIASADTTLATATQASGTTVPAFVFKLISSSNPLDAANTVTQAMHTGCQGSFDVLKGCFGGLPDLAWQPANTVSGFVANMFDNSAGHLITTILGAVIGTIVGHAVGSAASSIATGIAAALAIGATVATDGAAAPLLAAAPAIGSLVGGLTGTVVGWAAGKDILTAVVGIITFLIILCAILITLFRLWFQLVVAYITILINIVFGPIWIMLGLVPTSKVSFTTWFRNLVGNLSCFPTTLVMFLLARVFIDAITKGGQTFFVAPLVGAPGVSPDSARSLAAIIGMGIFLMTPSAVTQVKNALGGGSGLTFGGVGQGISAGAAVPMAGVKGVAAVRMKTPEPGKPAGWRGLGKMMGIG